jgi:hypothetical protein
VKFQVVFQREVTEIDQVIREVEAPDHLAAYRIAIDMANEFDMSCPDDARPLTAAECHDWKVEEILDV